MGGKGSSGGSSFDAGFQKWRSQQGSGDGPPSQQQSSSRSPDPGGGKKKPQTMGAAYSQAPPTWQDRAIGGLKGFGAGIMTPGTAVIGAGIGAATAKGKKTLLSEGTGPGFPVSSAKPGFPPTPEASTGGYKSLLSDNDTGFGDNDTSDDSWW